MELPLNSKILISGGNGCIGKQLSQILILKGYEVRILSRTPKKVNSKTNLQAYYWNVEEGIIDIKALENIDVIIHLAGENIGSKRWTINRKLKIQKSRIDSGKLIFEKCKELQKMPKIFISASAIGYYENASASIELYESDKSGNSFVNNVCREWEQIAKNFKSANCKTVVIRTGIVFAEGEGVLKQLMLTTQYGFGIILGNGNQFMPWIHITDLCRIYLKAVEDTEMQGVYNAVAPEHNTFQNVIQEIAMHKKIFVLKIPAFIVKIIFGEMSEILLKGNKISSAKLIKQKFEFNYNTLKLAINNLIN
jgi:uncharacterized protein